MRSRAARAALGAALAACAAVAAATPLPDVSPADLSLEDLLQIEVSGASKFPQKMTEAPASVTVITADQIRAGGYRTLAEILNGVVGLYVDYDRNYSYLGVRGFARPGDYNARVLLLVDGYRLNDPVYDQATVGTEAPIDVDDIERVEVVRGPGSSVYGSNAFFGVINIITRRGRDLAGGEALAEAGSYGTDREHLSGGGTNGGLEWLASGTHYQSQGQDLFYPEFDTAANNHGVAVNADGDRANRAFAKLAYGDVAASAAFSTRTKHIPTASYGIDFNDPTAITTDEAGYVDLSAHGAPSARWQVDPHVFYGHYRYSGVYPTAGVQNIDAATAEWWGAELKALGRFGAHRLLAGGEFQYNAKQDQLNYDARPYKLYLDDRRHSHRAGVYLQDEAALGERWLLDTGLRYDHTSATGDSAWNPRLALIWHAAPDTDLKALYGTAYRAPNFYELYYAADPNKANPGLDPEHISSAELTAEQRVHSNLRLTASLYDNRIRDLINQVTDPADGKLVYRNIGRAEGRGLELAAERVWESARLRAAYAVQRSVDRDTHMELTNSPRHQVTLDLSVPVLEQAWHLDTGLDYLSPRTTLAGARAPARVLVDLTARSREFAGGFTLAAAVRNVLGRANADPARPEHTQDVIPQDGRNYSLTLEYRYR